MAKCPICGTSVEPISSHMEGRYLCPHCGLILKRRAGEEDIIHGNLEVVDYIERVVDNIERNGEDASIPERQEDKDIDTSPRPQSNTEMPDLPEIREHHETPTDSAMPRSSETSETAMNEAPTREDKFDWGHCNHCHAVIVLSNSKFCSNCGASLGQGLEDATPLGMNEKGKSGKNVQLKTKHAKECMVCNLDLNQDDDVAWCPHCGSPAHRTHLLEWIHVKNSCPICGKHLSEQDFKGS
jgi:predicted RNA-binding Zn-ribbon protein involved in translation (DUF1610 family)